MEKSKILIFNLTFVRKFILFPILTSHFTDVIVTIQHSLGKQIIAIFSEVIRNWVKDVRNAQEVPITVIDENLKYDNFIHKRFDKFWITQKSIIIFEKITQNIHLYTKEIQNVMFVIVYSCPRYFLSQAFWKLWKVCNFIVSYA